MLAMALFTAVMMCASMAATEMLTPLDTFTTRKIVLCRYVKPFKCLPFPISVEKHPVNFSNLQALSEKLPTGLILRTFYCF